MLSSFNAKWGWKSPTPIFWALRKMRCENVQNGDSISVPFLTNERHFSSRKTGNILFYKEIYDWEKREKKEDCSCWKFNYTKNALMPSCLVRIWEQSIADLRSVSLHERNFPQDSIRQGSLGEKQNMVLDQHTAVTEFGWISSVVTLLVTLWIWMIKQIFA